MYGFLRQSTAANVLAGPFNSATDGVTPNGSVPTPAAAGSGAASGVALLKNGTSAGYTINTNTGAGGLAWAHDRIGYYPVALSAGDTGTLGQLKMAFLDPANYTPVEMVWTVLSQAIYDWLFGASAPPSAAAIATAVLTDTTTGDLDVAGSPGAILTTNLDAKVSTRSTYNGGQVASVANLTGMTLDGGTVSASPTPTSSVFAATGLPGGLVTGDLNGQTVIFQTGARAGVRRTITTHIASGGVHTFTLATAMGGPPAAADTFLIC